MIEVNNEVQMREFGEKFGRLLKGGEVIELIGNVGAGKTTFVRGLALGMSVDETIQSPSFTISKLYDATDGKRLAHYDFYRLNEPGIMSEELTEMISAPGSVVVIEWADTVDKILPLDKITLKISTISETSRVIVITSGGPDSNKIVEQVR